MREAVVTADPEHRTAAAPEIVVQITEFDGLGGTARCVVLGVEVKHRQMLPQLVAQIEQCQIGVRQFEQRSGLSSIQHVHLPSTSAPLKQDTEKTGGFYQGGSDAL